MQIGCQPVNDLGSPAVLFLLSQNVSTDAPIQQDKLTVDSKRFALVNRISRIPNCWKHSGSTCNRKMAAVHHHDYKDNSDRSGRVMPVVPFT
jgi:hypothetical protein